MASFLGQHDVKADIKGRVVIPATYRKLLPAEGKDRVVIRRDKNYLVVYPLPVWEEVALKLKSRLNMFDKVKKGVMLQFSGLAEEIEIDNQGRILLSKSNLDFIGSVNNEVRFIGNFDTFVIWTREGQAKSMIPDEEFEQLLEDIMADI